MQPTAGLGRRQRIAAAWTGNVWFAHIFLNAENQSRELRDQESGALRIEMGGGSDGRIGGK